jgi:hypothetical protein
MARLIDVNGNVSPVQPAQGGRFQVRELEHLVGSRMIDTVFLSSGEIMIVVRSGKNLRLPGNSLASKLWANDQQEVYTSDRLVGPVVVISKDELPEILLRATLDTYYENTSSG